MNDAWGGSWGFAYAWGGAWGNSWGPLHEVHEWDTTQGTAPKNLKFTPVQDAHVVVSLTGLSAGIGQVEVFGSAAVSPAGQGARAGVNPVEVRGVANAYTRVRGCGSYASVGRVHASGDSAAGVAGVGCRMGVGRVGVSGAASVLAESVGGYAGAGSAVARGVQNPSAAQLAMIAYQITHKKHYNLLTSKYDSGRLRV